MGPGRPFSLATVRFRDRWLGGFPTGSCVFGLDMGVGFWDRYPTLEMKAQEEMKGILDSIIRITSAAGILASLLLAVVVRVLGLESGGLAMT